MDIRAAEAGNWSLFFSGFYGPQYCEKLTKDLEKFKYEHYDGHGQRFLREWVQPTVELLERLREMGFPIRNQNHIVVHLYNPVDSMAAGEFHFQVGRKAPGRLTLKFTKMAPNCTYMIQPRSLSNAEERRLCGNPSAYLEQVKAEMRATVLDVGTILRTVVLMTDNCQLERCCALTLFGYNRRIEPQLYSLGNPRMPVASDTAASNVPSAVLVNARFKNYGQYGQNHENELFQIQSGSGPRFPPLNQNSFNSVRTQLRAEPEEDDETVGPGPYAQRQFPTPSPSKGPVYQKPQHQGPQPVPVVNLITAQGTQDLKRSPEPYGHIYERSTSNSTTNSRGSNESLEQSWHDASPSSRKTSVKTAVLDEYATGNHYLDVEDNPPPLTQAVEMRASKGRSESYDAQMVSSRGTHNVSPRTWSVDAYMDSEGSSGDYESGKTSSQRTGIVNEYVDGGAAERNLTVWGRCPSACANEIPAQIRSVNGRFDSWVSHGEESVDGSLLIPAPVRELNRTLQQMRLRTDNREN